MSDSLSDSVRREGMISVSLDPSNIVKAIQKLSKHVKEQGDRIAFLESQQAVNATKADITAVIANAELVTKEATNMADRAILESGNVRKEMGHVKEAFLTTIDSKCSELLFTTSIATKVMGENLTASIDCLSVQFSEFKKQCELEQGKRDLEYHEDSAELTSAVQTLGDRVQHQHSEFLKHCKDGKLHSGAKASQSDQGDNHDECDDADHGEELGLSARQMDRLFEIVQQNHKDLMITMSEQKLHADAIDDLCQAFAQLPDGTLARPGGDEEPPVVGLARRRTKMNRKKGQPLDIDIRVKERNDLASTVGGLDDRMNVALQDIMTIKNMMSRDQKDVRNAVLAINDEFTLIRNNASGLENLPPLNLATCVPSFFNNPSFTFAGEDGSSCSSGRTTDRSIGMGVGGRKSKLNQGSAYPPSIDEEPKRCVRRVSGLLHLVSHVSNQNGGRKNEPRRAPEIDSDSGNDASIETDASFASMDESPRSGRRRPAYPSVAQEMSPELQEEVRQIVADNGLLKEMMELFHNEKDELMSAVDRKVDRDMVERLFNNFRTLMMKISERVNELSQFLGRCATQQDIEAVVKVVTHVPEATGDQAAGVKLGPECLVCGRAKSSLTGQVAMSAALRGAGVTANIQTANNGGNFVYGDGAAFRGAALMESFPHFKLPMLKNPPKRRD